VAAAQCLDVAHCWVVGDDIWFTSDLGADWRDIAPKRPDCKEAICGGPSHTLTDVEFTSPTDGWVVGGIPCGGYGATQCASYLAHTTDGGSTWLEAPPAVSQRYPFASDIACAGSHCVVAGSTFADSVLTVTEDGGGSWRQSQQVAGIVNALACSPDDGVCILATGRDGHGGLLVAGGG
jgi:photosystem II stability/assembly factor-like uncharacterized protein